MCHLFPTKLILERRSRFSSSLCILRLLLYIFFFLVCSFKHDTTGQTEQRNCWPQVKQIQYRSSHQLFPLSLSRSMNRELEYQLKHQYFLPIGIGQANKLCDVHFVAKSTFFFLNTLQTNSSNVQDQTIFYAQIESTSRTHGSQTMNNIQTRAEKKSNKHPLQAIEVSISVNLVHRKI